MKFFEITIKPLSGFGTPLKGDTLFGHFCWQASHDPALLNGGLDIHIQSYAKRPFAVFSSVFPKIMTKDRKEYYALKKPNMPGNILFPAKGNLVDTLKQAKKNKKKKWMLVETKSFINLSDAKFITEKQLIEKLLNNNSNDKNLEELKFEITVSQQHNTINRLTGTTGKDQFSPYLKEISYYITDTTLSVFIVFDEKITDIERIVKGLKRIGSWGFGRDASTGAGRFSVNDVMELNIDLDSSAFYTLAPCVLDATMLRKSYLTTFTRFGKHGDRLVYSKNPFKNPVIMADEASVFVMKDKKFDTPYIGSAVTNVSKSMPEAVVQGYAPCLPIKLE